MRIEVEPMTWEADFESLEIGEPLEKIVPDPFSESGQRTMKIQNVIWKKRRETEAERLKKVRKQIKAESI